MKEIGLTRGLVSIVDDDIYEELSKHKWHALKIKRGFYAARTTWPERKMVLMHRQILSISERGIQIDHIDGNSLNNCRTNLRICNNAENNRNKALTISNTSGFKGVSWNSDVKKWNSRIKYNYKTYHIGLYNDLKECALSYDIAALLIHGEFAKTNGLYLDESIPDERKQQISGHITNVFQKNGIINILKRNL